MALADQPVERREVLALLGRHLVDRARRGAVAQHRALAGIDPDGAVFAGVIDPDHAFDQFVFRRIAR